MERELLPPTNSRRRDVAVLLRPVLHCRSKQLFLSYPLRSSTCLLGRPGSVPVSVYHEGFTSNNSQRPPQGRGRLTRVLPASGESPRGAFGAHAFPAPTHVQERRRQAGGLP